MSETETLVSHPLKHTGLHNEPRVEEPILRSWQSPLWSRNSSPFMATESSLPYWQQLATGPYPEQCKYSL